MIVNSYKILNNTLSLSHPHRGWGILLLINKLKNLLGIITCKKLFASVFYTLLLYFLLLNNKINFYSRCTKNMKKVVYNLILTDLVRKGGEIVKVIDSPFIGVECSVARVSGQQRVIVTLANIGLISTAYIPTAFLEIINS